MFTSWESEPEEAAFWLRSPFTLTPISLDMLMLMLMLKHSHKYMPANPSFIFFQAVFHFCPPCTEVHILDQGKATQAL